MFNSVEAGVFLPYFLKKSETRTAGTNGKVGIEGENDEVFDPIPFNAINGFFGKGMPVTHSDIDFSVCPLLLQVCSQRLSLIFCNIP